ncbi:MAG: glycoside hydrolase family 3 N-terminal domain-containing protein, partial [Rikenellaceae bacterium]
MKKILYFVGSVMLFASITGCSSEPKYKDSKYSVEERVKDLVSRMTLEEKVAQMDMLRAKEIVVDTITFNEENLVHYIDKMNIGAIHDFYPQTAEMANALQKRCLEGSRLGIPIIFIEEALHGYGGKGSTNFPIPLGNASTWDTTMMNQIGKVIGAEARAHGVHFVLGPNLDLSRDIRWGRVEETFGEDVYLSARMGVNLIKGMQGDTLAADNTVAAEPKHYAVHGEPENGHNAAPAHIGEREARSEPLYVFEKAVKEANARGIMAAYHDLDGIPCISNKWLLTDVLRDDWGFNGFVVSDLDAIALQLDFHMTAATEKEAVAASINAGLNMQFYDFPYDVFQSAVIEAVKDGSIPMATIDSAVGDILRVKFELGLFDNPYIDPSLIAQRHRTAEHQQLALDVARSSITLLKNDNNVLPFSNDVKTITVVGNLADVSSLGGYSPIGARGVTVYEGLKKRFGDNVKINLISNSLSKNFSNIPLNLLTENLNSTQKGLRVDFFNNDDLEGQPVYTAYDDIAPYWHNLSPAPGVNDNNFSARWSGYV